MAEKSNKELKTITTDGKNFIKYVVGLSDRLSGSYIWNMKDSPIKAYDTVTAKINYNGKIIKTNEEFVEALIYWYNKYGKEFNVNPNILAAQGYAETGYNAYAYAKKSTAMGMSQFTVDTIYSQIIKNFYGKFTKEEIGKITKGTTPIEGQTINYLKNYFIIKEESKYYTLSTTNESNVALANKPILYQNVINNPDIMIKAQAIYLRGISDFHENVAASALILYFAGPLIKINNTTTINNGKGTDNFGAVVDELKRNANKYPSNRLYDGLLYCRKIFKTLSNNLNGVGGRGFGFKLNLDEISGDDLINESKSHNLRKAHPIINI